MKLSGTRRGEGLCNRTQKPGYYYLLAICPSCPPEVITSFLAPVARSVLKAESVSSVMPEVAGGDDERVIVHESRRSVTPVHRNWYAALVHHQTGQQVTADGRPPMPRITILLMSV